MNNFKDRPSWNSATNGKLQQVCFLRKVAPSLKRANVAHGFSMSGWTCGTGTWVVLDVDSAQLTIPSIFSVSGSTLPYYG